MRQDLTATKRDAEILIRLSRAHKLPMFLAFGTAFRGWSGAGLGEGQLPSFAKAQRLISTLGTGLFVRTSKGCSPC